MLNVNSGIRPTAARRGGLDPSGNVWFGGMNGTLVEIDANANRLHEYRPPTPYAPPARQTKTEKCGRENCLEKDFCDSTHEQTTGPSTRPQGSLQNRPYGVTSKPAMGRFPELRCCTPPPAFRASLISEISRWRPISSPELEKISFR
jgi:hypothetical protein